MVSCLEPWTVSEKARYSSKSKHQNLVALFDLNTGILSLILGNVLRRIDSLGGGKAITEYCYQLLGIICRQCVEKA